MTCDRFRPKLALLVGNDLDPREASEVRQHLGGCPACQAQWDAIQASTMVLKTVVLHSVARQATLPASGSLWPMVRAKLVKQSTRAPESTPSWFTIGAFSAVCAAVVWLTLSTPVFDFDVNSDQIAELDGERDVAKPATSRFPELHLVDDAQAPVQIFPEGEAPARMSTPPSSFGDPRSF
jgi:anti-sigma factor RsiW